MARRGNILGNGTFLFESIIHIDLVVFFLKKIEKRKYMVLHMRPFTTRKNGLKPSFATTKQVKDKVDRVSKKNVDHKDEG